jgi:hypothetical protein
MTITDLMMLVTIGTATLAESLITPRLSGL